MLLQIVQTTDPRGFRLVGEMDISNAGTLESALAAEVARGGDVVLDLAGLAFMDSSGIQVIIRAAHQLGGGGKLILLGAGDLVRRSLERIRLGQLANVEIVDENEALERS